MRRIDIKKIDASKACIHYTSIKNLDSIEEKGLLPRIGDNSRYIERTEKIFFCVGEEGFLMIMNVWLKWLAVKVSVPGWFYKFGCWWLRSGFTPKFLSTIYIKVFQGMGVNRRRSMVALRKILEESVVLLLDIKEGEDFSYKDIDEAKSVFEVDSAIKYMYPDKNRILDDRLEYWNMHMFTGKRLPASRISLLEVDGSIKASDILEYMIERNQKDFREKYPLLFDYYRFLQIA